jgi:hypothetical protein
MEIIKIVLDCMKENGIYPFNWCRIKKWLNVLTAKLWPLERKEGKKGAERAVSFLEMSGVERNELFSRCLWGRPRAECRFPG